jgi:thioredoxin 1
MVNCCPAQVFFDKDGKPFVSSQQNSKGFILYFNKDDNKHILTLHEGAMTDLGYF